MVCKNLVYFACTKQREYLECIALSIKSIEAFCPPHTFDILVLHDQILSEAAKDLKSDYFPVHTFQTECSNVPLKDRDYWLRYCIFNWPLITNYKNALYLDSDILVSLDLTLFLNQQLQPKFVYVYGENQDFNSSWFNASPGCFQPEECAQMVAEGLYTINSGTFLFAVSQDIKRSFEHMVKMVQGNPLPFTDQPFFNSYFLRLKMAKYLFDKSNYILGIDKTGYLDRLGFLHHFSGHIGNGQAKLDTMKNYYNLLVDFKENANLMKV